MDPKWLTEAEQLTWRKLAAVLTLLPAELDAQLQREAQLTHFGYWVLAMLSEAPHRCLRMSELAAMSNSSLSRLSHQVSRLEQQGWVIRTPAPDDRRGQIASLTDAGWVKVVDSAPGHVRQVRASVFDRLTPTQVAELDRICSALLGRASP